MISLASASASAQLAEGDTALRVQERDPRSYQIYLHLPGGACFLGSTPEQLYVRTGQAVASEAVAATRPRGPAGASFLLTFLLLVMPFETWDFIPWQLCAGCDAIVQI